MLDAVNNSPKQRGRPFAAGRSGNPKGRPKGSRNKRTRSLIEAAEAGGELPLDYMLRTMRDPAASAKRRDEMAKLRRLTSTRNSRQSIHRAHLTTRRTWVKTTRSGSSWSRRGSETRRAISSDDPIHPRGYGFTA